MHLRKSKRRVIAFLLAAVFVSSTIIFSHARSANSSFSDSVGHWAEAYIEKWSANGVIFGYGDGTFRPENNVTKAEFASVLNQLFRYSAIVPNTFTDVSDTDWFAPIIQRLVAADVIIPENNMINPNEALTRGELLVMIAKAYNISPIEGETTFLDDADIDAAQKPYVKALEIEGLIVGYATTSGFEIRTNRLLTRAEMLTVIDRAEEGESIEESEEPSLSEEVASAALPPGRASTRVAWPEIHQTPTPTPTPSIEGDNDSYSQIFSITDIEATPNGSFMAIQVTAEEACFLEVRVLSDVSENRVAGAAWNSGQLIMSARMQIEGDTFTEFIEVNLDSSLPDYFVVEATLVDHNGTNLCDPFVFINFTLGFENFLALTIHDFDELTVISYTDEIDNNFIVLSDGVHYVVDGENGQNNLDSSRAEQHIYVFENANETIQSLQRGDRLVILHRNGFEKFLAEVSSISHSNGRVTINANEHSTLDQFIVFMKIDMYDDFPVVMVELSEADESELFELDSTHQGLERGFSEAASLANILPIEEGTFEGNYFRARSVKIAINDTNSIELDCSLRINITGHIQIRFNALNLLIGELIYCRFTFDITAEVKGSMEFESDVVEDDILSEPREREIDIGRLRMKTKIPGVVVTARLTVPITVALSGKAEIQHNVTIHTGIVFSFTSGSGSFQVISPIHDNTTGKQFTGKISTKFGPKIELSTGLYGDKVKASILFQLGVEANATIPINNSGGTSRHLCTVCVTGKIYAFRKPSFKLSHKIFSTGSVLYEREFWERKWHLYNISPFFVSIINPIDSLFRGEWAIGLGEKCPNIGHRITLVPVNEQNQEVMDALITIRSSDSIVHEGTGRVTAYLINGEYIASVTAPGLTFIDTPFIVEDDPRLIRIQSGGSTLGTPTVTPSPGTPTVTPPPATPTVTPPPATPTVTPPPGTPTVTPPPGTPTVTPTPPPYVLAIGVGRRTLDGRIVADIQVMWSQFQDVEEYHVYYRLRGLSDFRYAGSTQSSSLAFTTNYTGGAEIRLEATTATSRIVLENITAHFLH